MGDVGSSMGQGWASSRVASCPPLYLPASTCRFLTLG